MDGVAVGPASRNPRPTRTEYAEDVDYGDYTTTLYGSRYGYGSSQVEVARVSSSNVSISNHASLAIARSTNLSSLSLFSLILSSSLVSSCVLDGSKRRSSGRGPVRSQS